LRAMGTFRLSSIAGTLIVLGPPQSISRSRSMETTSMPVSDDGRHLFLAAPAGKVPVKIFSSMDPRLQRLVSFRRRGYRKFPTTSTGEDEAAVVARVTDADAWKAQSEVRVGVELGLKDADGTVLVTGRVAISRLEVVRQLSFVKSLKAAQRLRPTLNKTIEETGARADLLPPGHLADGGRGVIVGIVDFGCDFVHKNFRNADGSTRLLALWDQSEAPTPTSPVGYGRLYTR